MMMAVGEEISLCDLKREKTITVNKFRDDWFEHLAIEKHFLNLKVNMLNGIGVVVGKRCINLILIKVCNYDTPQCSDLNTCI